MQRVQQVFDGTMERFNALRRAAVFPGSWLMVRVVTKRTQAVAYEIVGENGGKIFGPAGRSTTLGELDRLEAAARAAGKFAAATAGAPRG